MLSCSNAAFPLRLARNICLDLGEHSARIAGSIELLRPSLMATNHWFQSSLSFSLGFHLGGSFGCGTGSGLGTGGVVGLDLISTGTAASG